MTLPPDGDALDQELAEWVDRYLLAIHGDEELRAEMEHQLYYAPGEAMSNLLCAYVLGHWDLDEVQLRRIWLLGRLYYPPEHLVSAAVLAEAVPGRVLPPDPPELLQERPPLTGGGHGPGRGLPGKREFPKHWSDDETIERTMEVARQPSGAVQLPDGTFRAWGELAGVQLAVVVRQDGSVLTSYPVTGEGVVQNAIDEERTQHVRRLQSLLDAVPPDTGEPRTSLEELMAVGEWPHVVSCLKAMDVPFTPEQQIALDELALLTGPP